MRWFVSFETKIGITPPGSRASASPRRISFNILEKIPRLADKSIVRRDGAG
jgi:hypothetical protein